MSLRSVVCATLIVVAGCVPTSQSAGDDNSKLGSLVGEADHVVIVGQQISYSAQIIDATVSDGSGSISDVDVQFSIADPTIARIVGPSVVRTANSGAFTGALAMAHIEMLKEGTTEVELSVPGRTSATGAALQYSSKLIVSRPVAIVMKTSGNAPTDLPSPLDVPINAGRLPIHAELRLANGMDVSLGYLFKWSCPQGTAVASIESIDICAGNSVAVLVHPNALGTATFHVAMEDDLATLYPLSTDFQIRVTAPFARVDYNGPATMLPFATAQAGVKIFDASGNRLPDDLLAPWDPERTIQSSVDWDSSDPSVVDAGFFTGVLTAKQPGSATLTGKLYDDNGGLLATVTGVVNVLGSSNVVTIQPSSPRVVIGGHKALTAAITTAAGQPVSGSITWLTQNSSIVTVDANGVLTGVSTGTPTTTPSATAQVLARGGGAEGTVTVTVYRAVNSVDVTSPLSTLPTGQSTVATVVLKDASGNIIPNDATTISWSSSDATAATVDQSGRITSVYTGSGSAPFTIRATTAEGVSGIVDMTTGTVNTNPAASVVVSPADFSLDVGGASRLLTSRILDAGGVDTSCPTNLAWSTDVSAVAFVDQSGRVSPLGAGSSAVTAYCAASNVFGRALVRVAGTSGVARVYVNERNVFLAPGGATTTLTTTQETSAGTPANAPVTWQSSNNAVATVDASGKVTSVGTGGAIITATVDNQSSSSAVSVGAVGAINALFVSTSGQYPNGRVQVTQGGVQVATGVMDVIDHQVYIPGLAPGTYQVTGTTLGYPGVTNTVVVTAGAVAGTTFTSP